MENMEKDLESYYRYAVGVNEDIVVHDKDSFELWVAFLHDCLPFHVKDIETKGFMSYICKMVKSCQDFMKAKEKLEKESGEVLLYPARARDMFGQFHPCMVRDHKGGFVSATFVRCMEVTSQKSSWHKMICVYILAFLTLEGEEWTNLAYQCLQTVCDNSESLLSFLYVYHIVHGCRRGFGAGLRKALLSWYKHLDPLHLKIEISRCPTACKMSHKDILKLIHIKRNKFSIGHQVVLSQIFCGFAKTEKIFEDNEEAKEHLEYLKKFDVWNRANAAESTFQEKSEFIFQKLGKLSLQDFSTMNYVNPEIWLILIEKNCLPALLEGLKFKVLLKTAVKHPSLMESLIQYLNECDISAVSSVDIALSYCQCWKNALRLSSNNSGSSGTITGPFARIVDALSCVVFRSLKLMENPTRKANLYFHYIEDFDFNKRNGLEMMPPLQFAAYVMFGLSGSENFEKISLQFNVQLEFSSLALFENQLELLKKDVSKEFNYAEKIKESIAGEKDSCIFIVYEITKEIVANIETCLKELKCSTLRIILVECKNTGVSHTCEDYNSPLLRVYGANPVTLPAICAFHNRLE